MATSTKATFTPGPWRAQVGVSRIFISATGNQSIADVYGVLSEPEVAQANGRLIAAAPKLLAWIERVAYQPIGDAEASAAEILDTVTTEARAMLAKVEG